MSQVLHITAHMGGGVGKVLSGVAAYSKKNNNQYQHKILMLEPPEKTQFIDICKSCGVDIFYSSDIRCIEETMRAADIIQLEWWHHPKMAEFLHLFPQIPVRMVIWSHISGCNYPVIPFEFVKAPHRFIFTAKYSIENPHWDLEQKSYVEKNTEVLNSSGGFDHIPGLAKTEHSKFNIGYVGTLNYSKLHPDFINYCAAVDVPDARFIMVGDTENEDIIKREAEQKGILKNMEFTGYSNDIMRELARFDVFAYPLNPDHFGTTENALLEAMAAGLPVVALNQCTEKYLIEHMETGMLANNIQEYATCIKYLYENPAERKRIGENARKFIDKELTVDKTVAKLNNVYDRASKMPAQIYEFDHIFGEKPYQWFLSCLGNERKNFEKSIDEVIMTNKDRAWQIENKIRDCRLILKEKSKSSIYQFNRYFYDDEKLQYWAGLLDKG